MRTESDIPRFSFAAYLVDHWAAIAIGVLCVAGTVVVAAVLGVGVHACVLMAGLIAPSPR